MAKRALYSQIIWAQTQTIYDFFVTVFTINLLTELAMLNVINTAITDVIKGNKAPIAPCI